VISPIQYVCISGRKNEIQATSKTQRVRKTSYVRTTGQVYSNQPYVAFVENITSRPRPWMSLFERRNKTMNTEKASERNARRESPAIKPSRPTTSNFVCPYSCLENSLERRIRLRITTYPHVFTSRTNMFNCEMSWNNGMRLAKRRRGLHPDMRVWRGGWGGSDHRNVATGTPGS
jgi:hypothetical protein